MGDGSFLSCLCLFCLKMLQMIRIRYEILTLPSDFGE